MSHPAARNASSPASGYSAALRRLAWAVAYLAGWFLVLQPVLKTDLQAYGPALDPVVRTMQIAGLLIIATAVVGVWIVWRMFKAEASWLSRI
jgi:hypothetical protein